MEENLQELISKALVKAKNENQTRENALTITKLQEALMWNKEHQQALIETARRSGVGFTQNVQAQPPSGTQVLDDNGRPVNG